MGMVAAKCTQCGANIEVDETKEAGICKFCGTAFITEKAVNNYNTYITNNNNYAGANISVISGNIENLLVLAQNAIDAGNGKEAVEYANKALEIDPKSYHAWIIKMKSVEHIGTVGNPQVTEAISYGENAIANSPEQEQTKDEVYKYFLERAKTLLLISTTNLRNVAQIKQLAGLGGAAMSGVGQGDTVTRNLYLNLTQSALMLKLKVPDDYIMKNADIQNTIVELAKLYISVCEADVERISIYGQKLLDSAIQARQTTLQVFKKGLPLNKMSEISDDSVKKNNEGGCYIATCVYGSYDCPQVWTLRRFRDYTLAESWYGRAFIHFYYAISPKLVKWFGKTTWFKKLWKGKLDRMVEKLQSKGYESTSYEDTIW